MSVSHVPGLSTMSRTINPFRHGVARLALTVAAASVLAACSSDVERFSDYPPIDTGSVSKEASTTRPAPVAPVERVASRSLDAPASSPTPSWARPTYNGGSRDYAPVRRASRAPAPAASGTIVVQPGQTLYSIARANGVSVTRLAAANGIAYPYTLKVGQRLRIPGVANPVSPAPSFTPAAQVARAEPTRRAQPKYVFREGPKPAMERSGAAVKPTPVRAEGSARNFGRARTHKVAPGETLFALGRKYGVNPYRIASYNGLPRNVQLRVGQVVRIPPADGWSDGKTTQVSYRQPAREMKQAQPVQRIEPPRAKPRKDESRISGGEQAKSDPLPPARSERMHQQATSTAMFRWPVRGRIISTFGSKPNGTRNEGINIAVPEGTDVHAAADGIVAYAGNELKGYGNLILIRHKGGWVTAYAHNKTLLVKRGQKVRRGEVIAKAGRTGSVSTPQLHFEIRKGATAVNPLKYLNTATAMR